MATEPKTYKAWVLYHESTHEPGVVIERVYLDPIRAQEDFMLVNGEMGRWHLDETQLVGYNPNAVLDFFGCPSIYGRPVA